MEKGRIGDTAWDSGLGSPVVYPQRQEMAERNRFGQK